MFSLGSGQLEWESSSKTVHSPTQQGKEPKKSNSADGKMAKFTLSLNVSLNESRPSCIFISTFFFFFFFK